MKRKIQTILLLLIININCFGQFDAMIGIDHTAGHENPAELYGYLSGREAGGGLNPADNPLITNPHGDWNGRPVLDWSWFEAPETIRDYMDLSSDSKHFDPSLINNAEMKSVAEYQVREMFGKQGTEDVKRFKIPDNDLEFKIENKGNVVIQEGKADKFELQSEMLRLHLMATGKINISSHYNNKLINTLFPYYYLFSKGHLAEMYKGLIAYEVNENIYEWNDATFKIIECDKYYADEDYTERDEHLNLRKIEIDKEGTVYIGLTSRHKDFLLAGNLEQISDYVSSKAKAGELRDSDITIKDLERVSSYDKEIEKEHPGIVKEALSMLLDFVPFLGTAKSVQELFLGYDLITGENIPRSIAAAGLIASFVPVPGAKNVVKFISKEIKHLATNKKVVSYMSGHVVSFPLKKETKFYRVYSKDTEGKFLSKRMPDSRKWAEDSFALNPDLNTAEFVQEVWVPAGVRVQRSTVKDVDWLLKDGSIVSRPGGATQYELLEIIPKDSFKPGKVLK